MGSRCLHFPARGHWAPPTQKNKHTLSAWHFAGGSPHDDLLVSGCNQTTYDQMYVFDSDMCHLMPLDMPSLCQQLRGWHVSFVGDSVDSHLYMAFVMLLLGEEKHILCGPRAAWQGRAPSDRYKCTKISVCGGNTTLQFFREDWLTIPGGASNSSPPDNVRGVKRSESHGEWLAHSLEAAHHSAAHKLLLVVSAGEHPYQASALIQHMRTLNVLLQKAAAELQSTGGLMRVVHRSPIGGHPNCELATRPLVSLDSAEDPAVLNFTAIPNNTRVLGSIPGNTDTRLYHTSWELSNRLRPELNQIFVESGAVVLDANAPAALRPDLHPMVDRPSKGKLPPVSTMDCLHFCPNGAVVGTWALMLVNMIQQWGLLGHGPRQCAVKRARDSDAVC